jgi:HSP20 family molecular chaperone IbpA
MDMNSKDLEQASAREAAPLVPPVDVIEDADGIVVNADMPGVAREDVSIAVEGDTLTIEGVVKLGEPADMRPVYAEIGVAQFRRSFVLSRDLDTARIEAQMRNGVLRVRVPRSEAARPRRVEVRAG